MPADELAQRLGIVAPDRAVARRAGSADAVPALPEFRARAPPPALRIDSAQRGTRARTRALPERLPGPRADRRRIGGSPRDAARHPAKRRNVRPQLVDSWSAFVEGDAPLAITVSPISTGLVLTSRALALIAEEQLFGERARQERRRRRAERDPEKIIRDLTDLRPGSPVVHEDYGVGRFVGLATLDVGGLTSEFLVLEYADGDKLYVPVQRARSRQPLHRRAGGNGAAAQARQRHLGKGQAKAAQRIRDTAAELLDLYSRRAARQGEQLVANEDDLRAFEAAFQFEETPDQAQAIRAGHRRSAQRQTHGSRGVRRRRLRQDRSGAARGVRRGAGRQASRGAGADDAAGAAALPDVRGPLRRLAGEGRSRCRASAARATSSRCCRASSRARPIS